MSVGLIRTFHPVGQGAFYSEEFKDENENVVFRVVYDCGCINRITAKTHGQLVVKKVVAGWAGGHGKTIDYLFISHFDYDHVSLLRVLVEEGVSVRKVILPFLCPKDIVFYLKLFKRIYTKVNADFLGKFIVDPKTVLGPNTLVVQVSANAELDQGGSRFNEILNREKGGRGSLIVPSGTIFTANEDGEGELCDWCYVPRNIFYRADLLLLAKQFDHILPWGTFANFRGLMRLWTGRGFGALKKLYEKSPGGININSLVVYSGPEKDTAGWFVESEVRCNCKKNCHGSERVLNCVVNDCSSRCDRKLCRPSCIFTGDVGLANVDIKKWFDPYWDAVGTIQVPHHGSRHSFLLSVFEDGYYVCPISCSNESFYRHPSACVTNSLVCCRNFPIRVTETQSFIQTISKH